MKDINNVVITRSKIFGKNKNIGGLESYLKIFCETGSQIKSILLISGSGTYQYKNGSKIKLFNGFKTSNSYLLTIYVGFRALMHIFKNRKKKIHIFSFGLAGLVICIPKFFGLLKYIKLYAILFGLEFMIQSKNNQKISTRIQQKLGFRKFLGYFLLKNSDFYLTEYPDHKEEYIKHFPFLEAKQDICIPDPIDIPDFSILEKITTKRIENLNKNREVLFVSIGRDSHDKRRDLSIKFFKNLFYFLSKRGIRSNFAICVPHKSIELENLSRDLDFIDVYEGLENNEIQEIRKKAIFSICHSNQGVPLISILEDMSWKIIPISSDSLGGSLDNNCAILINNEEEAYKTIYELINKNILMHKSQLSFMRANMFSRENFSKSILPLLHSNE